MNPSSQSNPNPPRASRRDFIKSATLFAAGAMVSGHSLAAVLENGGGIALVVSPEDQLANGVPPQWALNELESSLKAQGVSVRRVTRIADVKPDEFCVVAADISTSMAKAILKQKNLTAPTEPESLCLVQGKVEDREVLLAASVDERGLVYAVTELADRVSCLVTSRAALEFSEPVVERPASRIRSMLRGFNSEVEDKVWFYDRDYWCTYLDRLVFSRVNRLNFATGMGYNSAANVSDGYLLFPYPFFVSVPGYDVTAKGLTNDERGRNLAMLKFIGEECARRGLLFQFGIWTLAYKWERSPHATYQIEGLTDDRHSAYCRDALAILLREVPQITGLTFRVHNESGIPKSEENFWQIQFSPIKECGRRVEIDMHFKNMTPETLQTALATGQPVCVSPKYCGEHLGLPYQQADIRELETSPQQSITDTGEGILHGNRKFTRYGYGDAFAENRTWDVVFRIWPGTQRFLLSGDPATFAGYGRAASFCGAAGIELSEPLFFKGRRGSGLPGGRLAYADKSLEPRYDFEKYLYTYRLWGRLSYNPDAGPEIWRRALRQEFGPAAIDVEQALAQASRVLPLFTLGHAITADCVRNWPEIYTNIPIADDKRGVNLMDTRAPKLFGNASPFDPQLFQSPWECAVTLVDGKATGKYSPLEAAQWLEEMAVTAVKHLDKARAQLGAKATDPSFRRVEEDVLIQRGLALFFANKLRCAVLWHIHTLTGDHSAGEKAIESYTAGRDAWATMAERAKTVYRPEITYGDGPTGGHWLDRIPEHDADIADLRERLEKSTGATEKVDQAAVTRALKRATAKVTRPLIKATHTPKENFKAGKALEISVKFSSPLPRRVILHYRHVNQAERWDAEELKLTSDSFTGEIPAFALSQRPRISRYRTFVLWQKTQCAVRA